MAVLAAGKAVHPLSTGRELHVQLLAERERYFLSGGTSGRTIRFRIRSIPSTGATMSVSSLPKAEAAPLGPAAPFVTTGIAYNAPATYHKRVSTRTGSAWKSSPDMPFREAILLAVRKFRIGEEPAVTCSGLSLFGIDAILAVRERPDFPETEADADAAAAPKLSAPLAVTMKTDAGGDTVIDLNQQRRHLRRTSAVDRNRALNR